MIIKVKVHAGARKDSIVKNEQGYIIHVKEKAEHGKANLAVVKIIAREFGVSSNSIRIKNPLSRIKLIEVKRDEIH